MRPWISLLCLACAMQQTAGSDGASHATQLGAWIGSDSARFVFPAEPRLELEWNAADSLAYPGRPEYAWEVYWEPEWSARGKVPHALWLVTYWDSGGARRGRLAEMLRPWPVWAMTECLECDGVSIAKEDSALTATLAADHVEFSVRGAPGVRRIFPSIPDSVRLIRRLGSEAEDEEITVPARRWGEH
jgi:hypothetical protein